MHILLTKNNVCLYEFIYTFSTKNIENSENWRVADVVFVKKVSLKQKEIKN